MTKEIIAVIGINGLAAAFFLISYFGAFGGMLAADIRVNAGRRTLSRARKKYKGFWKKLLYLDFKDRIDPWHYFLFVLFMISFPLTVIFINVAGFSDNQMFDKLIMVSGIPCFISFIIASGERKDLKNRKHRR